MKKLKYPTGAIIAVTYRCNSRCLMCNIWQKEQKEEVDYKVYEKLPSGLKSIDITGGEPFLRTDLVKIVYTLKKNNPIARLLITTNGLLTEKIKKTVPLLLKIDNNLAFRVSIDGFQKTHDKIRGVKWAFKKAVETLTFFKEINVKDLGIIFTLNKLNYSEIEKVLGFCKQKQLKFSLNTIHNSPIYFGNNHEDLSPKIKDSQRAIALVAKHFLFKIDPIDWVKAWFYLKTKKYIKSRKRSIACGAGKRFFYLDPQGNIFACQFKNWRLGNLENQSFNEIWKKEIRRKYLNITSDCHDCWMVCTIKDIASGPLSYF